MEQERRQRNQAYDLERSVLVSFTSESGYGVALFADWSELLTVEPGGWCQEASSRNQTLKWGTGCLTNRQITKLALTPC